MIRAPTMLWTSKRYRTVTDRRGLRVPRGAALPLSQECPRIAEFRYQSYVLYALLGHFRK